MKSATCRSMSEQQQVIGAGESSGPAWETLSQCHSAAYFSREERAVHTQGKHPSTLGGECKDTDKGRTGWDKGTWKSEHPASLEDKLHPLDPSSAHNQDRLVTAH